MPQYQNKSLTQYTHRLFWIFGHGNRGLNNDMVSQQKHVKISEYINNGQQQQESHVKAAARMSYL